MKRFILGVLLVGLMILPVTNEDESNINNPFPIRIEKPVIHQNIQHLLGNRLF